MAPLPRRKHPRLPDFSVKLRTRRLMHRLAVCLETPALLRARCLEIQRQLIRRKKNQLHLAPCLVGQSPQKEGCSQSLLLAAYSATHLLPLLRPAPCLVGLKSPRKVADFFRLETTTPNKQASLGLKTLMPSRPLARAFSVNQHRFSEPKTRAQILCLELTLLIRRNQRLSHRCLTSPAQRTKSQMMTAPPKSPTRLRSMRREAMPTSSSRVEWRSRSPPTPKSLR